jgi:zinc-binding in reverse transcriptase
VNNTFVNNYINLEFKRQFVGVYLHEWNNLLFVTNKITINSSLSDICT